MVPKFPESKGSEKQVIGLPVGVPIREVYEPCDHQGTKVKGVKDLYGSSWRKGLDPNLAKAGVPALLLDAALLDEVILLEGPFTSLPVEQVGEGFKPFKVQKFRDFIFWPWPDREAPKATKRVVKIFENLAKFNALEVACYGGHGRTGTALAILAALKAGWKTLEAVDKLRAAYCKQAVETTGQYEFVAEVLAAIRGEPAPELKWEIKPITFSGRVKLVGELVEDTNRWTYSRVDWRRRTDDLRRGWEYGD